MVFLPIQRGAQGIGPEQSGIDIKTAQPSEQIGRTTVLRDRGRGPGSIDGRNQSTGARGRRRFQGIQSADGLGDFSLRLLRIGQSLTRRIHRRHEVGALLDLHDQLVEFLQRIAVGDRAVVGSALQSGLDQARAGRQREPLTQHAGCAAADGRAACIQARPVTCKISIVFGEIVDRLAGVTCLCPVTKPLRICAAVEAHIPIRCAGVGDPVVRGIKRTKTVISTLQLVNESGIAGQLRHANVACQLTHFFHSVCPVGARGGPIGIVCGLDFAVGAKQVGGPGAQCGGVKAMGAQYHGGAQVATVAHGIGQGVELIGPQGIGIVGQSDGSVAAIEQNPFDFVERRLGQCGVGAQGTQIQQLFEGTVVAVLGHTPISQHFRGDGHIAFAGFVAVLPCGIHRLGFDGFGQVDATAGHVGHPGFEGGVELAECLAQSIVAGHHHAIGHGHAGVVSASRPGISVHTSLCLGLTQSHEGLQARGIGGQSVEVLGHPSQ